MAVEGNKIRLKFQHAAGGLVAEGGKPLSHFTIAGEDQKFVPATAEIDGESLVVSSPEVAKPVAVRFGWDQNAEPNFYNKAGLPASPFRTDDWPLTSVGKK
jgi:sialate O-acetylesterase